MHTVEALFTRFARHGDVDALAAVFDQCAPPLLRLGVQLCGNETDAEDLLQATFLIAIEKARAFDAARSLTAWLVGILQKQAKALRRRQRRVLPAGEPRSATEPVVQVAAGELRDLVQAALLRLDRRHRMALQLRLVDGLSTVEIAQRLGRTPGSVRVQLHRGLERLRKWLPPGLVVGLAVSGRGLAAVRADVLAAARLPTAVGVGSVLGGMLMNKTVVVAGAVLAAALLWTCWPRNADLQGAGAATGTTVARAEVAASATPTERVPVDAPWATTDAAPIDARPGTLHVRLTYQDNGEPAADVPVAVEERSGFQRPKQTARTDAAGDATFAAVVPGQVWIHFTERLGTETEIQPGQPTTVTLPIDRACRVRGRVVDEHGAAVVGASILQRTAADMTGCTCVASSGVDGRFELFPVGLSVGFYSAIGARAAGGRCSPFVVGMPAADRSIAIELVLRADGADLTGRVVDTQGVPIARARLVVTAPEGDFERSADGSLRSADQPIVALTDEAGRFALLGVRSGAVPLTVTSADHVPSHRNFELVAGQTLDTEIVLSAGITMTGRILDLEGRAIAGAYVARDDNAVAFSDAAGAYVLPGLTPGSRSFTFVAPCHRFAMRVVNLIAGEEAHCDVALTPEMTITGKVIDQFGAPVPCSIDLMPAGNNAGQQSGRTDAAGRFALPSVPGLEWQLRLQVDGSSMCFWALDGRTVTSGSKDMVITVNEAQRATAWLRGRLVDSQGKPVRGATLTLICGIWRPRGSIADVADGSFRLGPLPSAEYWLEVAPRQPDLPTTMFGPFALAPHETRELGAVRVQNGGRLLVRAHRSDGEPLSRFLAELSDGHGHEQCVETNAMVAPGQSVAPGEYGLVVNCDNAARVLQPVVIRAGETTAVDLELEPAARRAILFPATAPAGWSSVRKVDVEIRRRTGESVLDCDFAPADERQMGLNLVLAVGSYVLRLTTDKGSRYEGEFAVTELLTEGPTIEVEVHALQ